MSRYPTLNARFSAAIDAAPKPGDPCPKCRRVMRPEIDQQSPLAWSRDHILPRERGGGLWMYADAKIAEATLNWRVMCKGCNNLLAVCGHCVGALVCAEAVAAKYKRSRDSILREWQMLYVAQRIPRLAASEARQLRIRRSPGGEARMQPKRSADPPAPALLPAEFVFPATSPAARVWNLATLARARG